MRNPLAGRPLMIAAILHAPPAAALWAAAALPLLPEHADRLVTMAAGTATLSGVVCAVAGTVTAIRPAREKQFLVDLIVRQHATITRLSSQAPTVPFPRPPGPRPVRPLRPVHPSERPGPRR